MSVLRDLLVVFPPERLDAPAAARKVEITRNEYALPMHRHTSGQLVLTLHGGVTCRLRESLCLVPPQCAVWVPAHTPHCMRVTAGSSVCMLFIAQENIQLPATCCTLSITPLVRELICHVASRRPGDRPSGHTDSLLNVLLTELAHMPVTGLRLPVSSDPRLQAIAEAIIDAPSARKTLPEWAQYSGMSRRSLARLVAQKTGLSFGRWRQQLLLIIAMQRLAEGATVQQTAWGLGYESVTAFITMFKKALGAPPAKYVQTGMATQ